MGELIYGLLQIPELTPQSVADPRYAQCPVTAFTPKRDLYQTENAQQELLRGVTTRQKLPCGVRTRAARRREGTFTTLGSSLADSAKNLPSSADPKNFFPSSSSSIAHHGSLRQGYLPGCCSQGPQRSITLRNTKKHLSCRYVVLWYDLQKTWVANLISSVCMGYNCDKVDLMIPIRTTPRGDRWLILVVGGVIYIPRSST